MVQAILRRIGPVALGATLITGCMLSDSVGSISDSISSPFEWSSSLSGGAAGAYRAALREQVLAFVEGGGSLEGFQREVGEVARRHGLLDWESEPASYLALGEGLRAAGVSGAELTRLEQELAGDDAARRALLRRGYDGWEGRSSRG